MLLRNILLASAAALLGVTPAFAQSSITENVNNTGIPRNAPALGLSNIYGLNPCSSGSSVGVTTPLFGVGGAIASIDKECETRNNAAVVITGLKDETLAREILCEIRDIRDAAIRVGKPCLRDQNGRKADAAEPSVTASASVPAEAPAPTQASAPTQAQAPAPTPVAAIKAVATIVADAPAFCRVPRLDLSLYPECTTMQPPARPQAAAAKLPPVAARQKEPVPGRIDTTPAATEKKTPEAETSGALKNPSWAEAISYRTGTVMGLGQAPMVRRAVVSSQISAPVAPTTHPNDPSNLIARGAAMVAAGDIVEARLFYDRAAEAGNATAAVELGKTYDPAFLARINAVGIQADPATADKWYRRAVSLGDKKATGYLPVAAR